MIIDYFEFTMFFCFLKIYFINVHSTSLSFSYKFIGNVFISCFTESFLFVPLIVWYLWILQSFIFYFIVIGTILSLLFFLEKISKQHCKYERWYSWSGWIWTWRSSGGARAFEAHCMRRVCQSPFVYFFLFRLSVLRYQRLSSISIGHTQ